MALKKLSEDIVDALDADFALSRIKNDLQSDFIYAPHLSAIFLLAGEELSTRLLSKLKEGIYEPTLPLTIEVPKASGFTRPGSILLPYERLVYQLVVDNIAPRADQILDRKNVFSNLLLTQDTEGFMFEPSGDCYVNYKDVLERHAQSAKNNYVLQADVVSHFQNVNQHNLINLLSTSGCDAEVVGFLDKLLSSFTEKNSRGIVQGVLPSDFLGNFSLCSIDGQLSVSGFTFARYVDDICLFFATEHECKVARMKLSQLLRKEGLDLNEAKTRIMSVDDFLHEETAIDRMFGAAKEELNGAFDRNDFYHSTISWDFDPDLNGIEREMNATLEATKSLFDYEVEGKMRDKIDKFCIPTFIAASDICAVDDVLRRYVGKPHLAQVYARYLQKMILERKLEVERVEGLIQNPNIIFEYQYLWLYAALMVAERVGADVIDLSITQLRNANLSPALRAVNAIFVAKFGNPIQKRLVKDHYSQEQSEYVRAAILYAARYLTEVERKTCYRAWGGHGELNSLIVAAARRTPGV